eukprot:jgi/Bigna1/89378/estExt_fgenesh1_pg.C_480072
MTMADDSSSGCCTCLEKSVIPDEKAKSRSSILLLLLGLQACFGLCRIVMGFDGMRGLLIGAVGYVGISNDAGFYINMIFSHAFLSMLVFLTEIQQVLSIWLNPSSEFKEFNQLSQMFASQSACLYLVATYISAMLYLELTQCRERVITQPSTAYRALSDDGSDGFVGIGSSNKGD